MGARGSGVRYRGLKCCIRCGIGMTIPCRGRHAASLLPHSASKTRVNALMGEKDRMRGFGRRSLILNLPNPLTPSLSPLGRGRSFLRQLPRTFMASASVLAARLGARVFRRAIENGSRACKNVVASSAKPVRSKERAGVGPAFHSSVELRQIKTSRNKRRKRNAGKRWVTTAASCDAARALLERARLTAFHRGSHLRELFHPKGSASGQASWDVV